MKTQINRWSKDILTQKRKKLNRYLMQFDHAVSLVTDTIDNLGCISQGIAETMEEIETYERELAVTKDSLMEAKAKNDKVIANFKSLLAAD